MSESIALQLVHEPRRRIAQVSIHAIHARELRMGTIRLPGYIVVIGANQSSFYLPDRIRRCIVESFHRLLPRRLWALRWRRYGKVRGPINEEH